VVELRARDLRVDVFRSGEEGTVVRVTHVPSGKAVTVDDQEMVVLSRDRAIALLEDQPGGD
jgi:protein subunit release factor A